jgi:hypothetical protein
MPARSPTGVRGQPSLITGRIERRTFVLATPREAWTALHDPASEPGLFSEFALGPAEPAWPAAGSTRLARFRYGLLRDPVLLESLEARPGRSFRVRFLGTDVYGEIGWLFEPAAGGTRVVHQLVIQPVDRWGRILSALERRSVADHADAHLRELKMAVEGHAGAGGAA